MASNILLEKLLEFLWRKPGRRFTAGLACHSSSVETVSHRCRLHRYLIFTWKWWSLNLEFDFQITNRISCRMKVSNIRFVKSFVPTFRESENVDLVRICYVFLCFFELFRRQHGTMLCSMKACPSLKNNLYARCSLTKYFLHSYSTSLPPVTRSTVNWRL